MPLAVLLPEQEAVGKRVAYPTAALLVRVALVVVLLRWALSVSSTPLQLLEVLADRRLVLILVLLVALFVESLVLRRGRRPMAHRFSALLFAL